MQVVFALLIYLIFSIPTLLFWPGRGLSFRNLSIALASAMLGLVVGFALTLALDRWIDAVVLMILMGAVIPAVVAFIAVHLFGGEGICVASKNSLLYRVPYRVALWAAASIACGTLVFAFTSWTWNRGADSGGWLLFAAFVVPLSVLQLVGMAGSRESTSFRRGLRNSAWSGGVVLLVSFFFLGPYFLFLLPVLLYAAIVPLVFSALIRDHAYEQGVRK